MLLLMETVTDAAGVTHEFTQPPRRIVSLVPSLTETVADLGCADRLVGITKFCKHPESVANSVEHIGGTKNPDIARIVQLKPDLVLANDEENRLEDYEALKSAGLRVFVTAPKTFTDGVTLLRQTGRILGKIAEADRIATEIERRLVTIEKEKPGRDLRLFYPVWNHPLMTINGDTFIHDVLTMYGFVNPFAAKRDRYPVVTEEELEKEVPQIILLPDEPFEFRQEHRAEWLMKSQYPASRRMQVYLVDGSYFCWYGSRQLKALDYLDRMFGVPVYRS